MSRDSLSREIHIDASPETVFDVVSRPEHISHWFSDEAEFVSTPGAQGSLSWREPDPGEAGSVVEITIVACSPPHLFSFTWVSPERQREDPGATVPVLVEFRITPDAGGSRLTVTESGLDAVGWDEARRDEYADDHTDGWVKFLLRLQSYAVEVEAADAS